MRHRAKHEDLACEQRKKQRQLENEAEALRQEENKLQSRLLEQTKEIESLKGMIELRKIENDRLLRRVVCLEPARGSVKCKRTPLELQGEPNCCTTGESGQKNNVKQNSKACAIM